MGRGLSIGLLVAALGLSASAAAEYEGVKPGSENPPPKVEEIPADTLMLTWPGFVMKKDGTSCFFVQTSQPVSVATKETPGQFDLVMRNTKVHLKNNYLPLETQFFKTPVTRATVQRKGSSAVMVFEMRDDVTPTIRQEKGKDGFNYVFVEFAPVP
ncbi:MAG: hypothetical protein AAGF92_05470 [Myxococcota bacterium]